MNFIEQYALRDSDTRWQGVGLIWPPGRLSHNKHLPPLPEEQHVGFCSETNAQMHTFRSKMKVRGSLVLQLCFWLGHIKGSRLCCSTWWVCHLPSAAFSEQWWELSATRTTAQASSSSQQETASKQTLFTRQPLRQKKTETWDRKDNV